MTERLRGRAADARVAAIAARQHGVVTRRQLLAVGISRTAVSRRLAGGLLRALHAGVYAVGPLPGPRHREMAAVLACGGGVISDASAAALHALRPSQRRPDAVELTIGGEDGRRAGAVRRSGLRVHRRRLRPDECTRIEGVPVTVPARTILDLSPAVPFRDLQRMLAAAARLDPAVRDGIGGLLERYPQRSGAAIVRRLLEATLGGDSWSVAEEIFLEIVAAGGLPAPEQNATVHGFVVDFYWRALDLAVEIDGYAYHRTPEDHARDCERDAVLAGQGVQVVRLSWAQLQDRDRTLVRMAQAIAHRQRGRGAAGAA